MSNPPPRSLCRELVRRRSAAASRTKRGKSVRWSALLDANSSVLNAYALWHSLGKSAPELFGKPDQNSFGTPDVAEPIRVLILDHFADEFRAALAEPGERIVDVLHGEHDAQVT